MNPRRGTALLIGGFFLLVPGSVRAAKTERTTLPDCRVSQLSIARGPEISPATGQNPLALRLTNRGQRICILDGYPNIAFRDRGGAAIPFPIKHGGDQMVTPRGPTRVVVRPGRSAFVLVNKFRCDLGIVRVARTLRLGLPGATSRPLSLALPPYPLMGYCGKRDWQSTVVTSPFEPSLAATLRQH
jgi:hypothetical protein